jgi:hypothetical protein
MWINLGPQATFTPYLLGSLTGAIPVYAYFVVFLSVTLAFIGVTSNKVMKELSNKDTLNAIIEKVELVEKNQNEQQELLTGIQTKEIEVIGHLKSSQGTLNRIIEQEDAINQSIETANQRQVKILNELQNNVNELQNSVSLLDAVLTNNKKQILNNISKQEKTLISSNVELSKKLGSQSNEIKETIIKQAAKVSNSLSQVKGKTTRTANAVKKQKAEIETIRVKLLQLDKDTVKLKDTELKMGIIDVKELKNKLK